MYDTGTAHIGGVIVKAKDILNLALQESGETYVTFAKKLGWAIGKLTGKVYRDSIRADELIYWLDLLGVDVTFTVRDTGKELRMYVKGQGKPTKSMVNGVTYDTAHADALSNDFYADGERMFGFGVGSELYVDKENRYFLVQYVEGDSHKPSILPVTKEIAERFIQKNGTDLNKKPETEN